VGHYRERYLRYIISKGISFSPIVGVIGHRQVGKTTLISHFSDDYESLDDSETFAEVNLSAKKFLQSQKAQLLIIDESQLAPTLFPALKEKVRLNKRPGQYILSGSVRFTARKLIRESLTGRIINFELLPFTVSEILHLPLPTIALQALKSSDLAVTIENFHLGTKDRLKIEKEIKLYLIRGGLPSLFFVRDSKLRSIKLNDQLITLLDRDLRLIHPTSLSLTQLFDFARELSRIEGQPINYAALEKKIQISEATQKKILYAMESIFLIRFLPIEGGKKGHVLYFEDQAEDVFLSYGKKDTHRSMEGLLFRNVRAQFHYQLGEQYRYFHFLTKNGGRVAFCVEGTSGVLGFSLLSEDHPTRSEMAAAKSFLAKYLNSKIIFVSPSLRFQLIDERIVILPLYCLV